MRPRLTPLLLPVLALALTGATACSVPPDPAPATSAAPGTGRPESTAASPSGPASVTAAPSASTTPGPSASASPSPAAVELPRGGRTVFPRYRLVGYAGVTGAPALGRLGTGPLDSRAGEIERRGRAYAAGREVLPVLEVIATIVQASPGRDGKYRIRLSDREIGRYYKVARQHRALLLLNIQPGRSEFLPEVKAYEKWLRRPDVGVALDPEWAMDPGQRPGGVYGHTTGAELDGVSRYLSGLVARHGLPEKVMVYHQVAAIVVRKESGLKRHPGVAVVKSVDGLGPPGPKVATYNYVNKTTPKHVHAGFKLFFEEDRKGGGRLMSPKEVLALKPRPEYVMYE